LPNLSLSAIYGGCAAINLAQKFRRPDDDQHLPGGHSIPNIHMQLLHVP
jgi:hypothetical protein